MVEKEYTFPIAFFVTVGLLLAVRCDILVAMC